MKGQSQYVRRNQGMSRGALLAAVLAASPAVVRGTTVFDTWYGLNGNWSNGGLWSAGGSYPNNAGSVTYGVMINQGTPALDVDATINELHLYNSAELGGTGHALTVNNLFEWQGGYIGYVNAVPTVTMGAGSTLTMETPPQPQGTPARLLWGTINGFGTTNYSGGGTLYINSGASFNNYGTFNLSAAGGILYSNGVGDFVNGVGGTFNKTGTTTSTVSANFTNAGMMALTAGTLQFESVTNSAGGVINAAAGTTLKLDGSTSNYLAGSDLTGAGAVMFTYGTHNFAAGTFHPTGPVSIALNATVNVKNAFTPASLGTIAGTLNTDVDQSFNDVTLTGHIGGAGTVTLGNTFTWTSGNLDRASSTVNGHTAIAAGAQATVAPASTVTSFRIIDNAGTITHTGGQIYLNSGGTLNNSGVFYASGAGGIGTTVSPAAVNNAGAFDLIVPVTYTVAVPFSNTGAVNVDAGTLVLSGTGSNAGTINVAAGGTLRFDSVLTHGAGSTIGGAGNLLFNFGTNDLTNATVSTTGGLTVAGNAAATFGNVFSPAGTVTVAGTLVLNTTASSAGDQSYADLSVSGTLGGSRNVVVTNHMDWNATGSSTINGTGRLTVAGGAVLDLSGGVKALQRPVDNYGRVNDGASTLYLNSGSSFNNFGVFNLTGGDSIANSIGSGAFNNSGTFNKGDAALSAISIPFNNAAAGVVNIDSGVLVLSGGGSNAGGVNVAAGATLRLAAGMTHSAGSSISGDGNLEFSFGVNDLTNTAVSTAGTFGVQTNATATLGNAITPAGTVTVAGTLVTNNTARSSEEQAFNQLVLSGALGGSRDVRVTGHLTWTGSSSASGTGKLTLGAGTVTDVDGTSKTITKPIDNYGTLNHTAGSFYVNTGAAVTNYGMFNAAGASGISSNNGFGTFTNAGTFEKSGAGAYAISVTFNNAAAGVVNLDAGTMSLSGGGSDSGRFSLAAGTLLTLAGNYTHNAGSLISGAGGVAFTSGTHVFPAGTFNPAGPVTFGTGTSVTINNTFTPSSVGTIQGNVTFNADESLGDVTMAGNVGGTGNLTFSGAFNWTSGVMSGAGTTTLPAGGTWAMTNNNSRTVARSVDSSAAATLSAGSVFVQNGATLTNRGTFDASTAGLSAQSGGGTFANAGTFNKTGTSTFAFPSGLPLLNSGTVNVNQGVLQLQGGGTNTGTINVSGGGTLRLDTNSYTFAAGSSLTGVGGVEFNGASHSFPAGAYAATGPLTVGASATVTFNGPIAPSSIAPIAGTLNVNANQTFTNLTLNTNGTLGGSGDFLVTGTLAFNGGTLAGTGKTDFQVGSVLDMTASGTRSVYRKVNTGGAVNYSAGTVTMYGTTWQLSSGLTVTGSNFLSWSASGATSNTVYNNAALSVNMSPTAEFNMGAGITLNSIGSVNVTSGKFTLGSVPTQLTAGGTLNAGTWWVGNAGNLNFVTGPNVTTVGTDAIVTLDGAGAKFDKLNALGANNGSFTLSNGRAFTTAGAFSNGGYVTVGGNAALTTAGVLTNSGQISVTSGGTLTASGAVSSTGTLAVAAGSKVTIANGLTQTGGYLVGDGVFQHAGGTSTVSASTQQVWSDGAALNVTGGTLTLASDAGGYLPNPTLAATVAAGATLRTSSTQRLKSLSIDAGGTFIQAAGGSSTLLTRSLSIAGNGRLDMNDDKLVVDYDVPANTPIEAVRQDIRNGRIVSSVASADPQARKAIGYAEASVLGVTSWGGLFIDPASVVAKLTWYGDANLDGQVDGDDYALLDRGMRMVLGGWVNGDFNYDGSVNSADYLLIDRVVAIQSGTLSPGFLASRESQFGPAYVAALVASVPEPASFGLAALAIPVIARRRRR